LKNNQLTASLAVPQGSLEAYIGATHQIPMLSLQEEQALAQQYRTENDIDAARKLVMAHLRYVVSVARGYAGYGLPQADLIQEGNIGLMKAVKRFDPDMGVRLVSFAVHWVRAEIHEYIIRNWRIVKIATTKAQRKLFFNLRKSKKRLGWFTQEQVAEVAQQLNVSTAEVLEMEKRLSSHDAPFDIPPETQDDVNNETFAPASYLEDKMADPATQLESADWSENREQLLNNALATLDERSRDILAKRWLAESKATLVDLANQYQVSAERIRQIENSALKKLKKAMS